MADLVFTHQDLDHLDQLVDLEARCFPDLPPHDLVAPETGLAEVESRAFGINDSGVIIGSTRPVGSREPTAFILIPAAGQ